MVTAESNDPNETDVSAAAVAAAPAAADVVDADVVVVVDDVVIVVVAAVVVAVAAVAAVDACVVVVVVVARVVRVEVGLVVGLVVVVVEDEATYNAMNQAMTTFNHKIFMNGHKSYYTDLDLDVLDEYRTRPIVGNLKAVANKRWWRSTFPRHTPKHCLTSLRSPSSTSSMPFALTRVKPFSP